MHSIFKTLLLILAVILLFFLRTCRTGYVHELDGWYWVTNDENYGRRTHVITGIDQSSFKVLKNKLFAVDKYRVYFKGKQVNYASPDGFTCLTKDEYGYAKDRSHVFLDHEIIPGADPLTFEILTFPYSKDKKDVYCGNIPLLLHPDESSSFCVTNEDKLMAGMKSTAKLVYFIEYNPAFKWLDGLALKPEYAITGDWGTGTTKERKFKGPYEIKNGKLLK